MFSFEYAKSNRAKCKVCKSVIKLGESKLIKHSFNQWSSRPMAESICAKCGVAIVQAEINLLQKGLVLLQNPNEENLMVSIRNTKVI